jgi:small GTP-binding protein
MIHQKVCLIGGFAVGKTSLVSRFVRSIFSDTYLTTAGVKIEKKSVDLGDRQVELVLWDIYGQDDYQKLRLSYLRGASGYLLVADGTRPATLDTALGLHEEVERTIGRVPFVLVLNKADLENEWEITDLAIARLVRAGWRIARTSAKTGDGVEEVFSTLARAMLAV